MCLAKRHNQQPLVDGDKDRHRIQQALARMALRVQCSAVSQAGRAAKPCHAKSTGPIFLQKCRTRLQVPHFRQFEEAREVACNSASGDVPVTADTLGPQAAAVRNFSFASFWLQLPLTAVSAGILIFAISFNKAPGDISRWFTLVGIIFSFISTFFAHGFRTLAKQAINEGKVVSRSFLVQNLVRNTNINLAGIGITLIGLQASVGTLVSKTMLAAANAPYAAAAPGGTLISLDVFSLQASTNTLLAHFLSIVFANCIVGAVNNIKGRPAAA